MHTHLHSPIAPYCCVNASEACVCVCAHARGAPEGCVCAVSHPPSVVLCDTLLDSVLTACDDTLYPLYVKLNSLTAAAA
jgi:hypothetical protein